MCERPERASANISEEVRNCGEDGERGGEGDGGGESTSIMKGIVNRDVCIE